MVYFPLELQLYTKFPKDARRFLHNPRYALLIAQLPPKRVKRLTSVGAIYWETYTWVEAKGDQSSPTGLLDDGLKAAGWMGMQKERREAKDGEQPPRTVDTRRDQVRLAFDMLGAIAFEMLLTSEVAVQKQIRATWDAIPNRIPYPSPETIRDRIEGDTKDFRTAVFERMASAGAYFLYKKKPLDQADWSDDWESLTAMNSSRLEYLILETHEHRISFRDITTRDFFATTWALRRGSDADLKRLASCYPDVHDNSKANLGYDEFWNLLIDLIRLREQHGDEINGLEPVCDKRSMRIIAPLYDSSLGLVDEQNRPIRLTEMINRTWELKACLELQSVFRSEFKRIRDGESGADKQSIAQRLLSNMLLLGQGERGEGDTGVFPNVGRFRNKAVSPFMLNRYCLTNLEYQTLFDGRFISESFHGKVQDPTNHPQVGISWYDAWCFAKYLGTQKFFDGKDWDFGLPTELQWEYACRAGLTKKVSIFGQTGELLESSFCNFNGKYPWSSDTRKANRGVCLGRTVPVDSLSKNRFGFWNMHGNVLEWGSEWYDDNRGGRVFRGGCWSGRGRLCLAGYRDWYIPLDRYWCLGCRLSAFPLSYAVE